MASGSNAAIALFELFLKRGIQFSFRFKGPWRNKMPPTYKWFKPEEVEGLNEEFVAKLDQARQLAGIPFRITSGLRTPEKNQSVVGSVPDSAHLKGLAVDLRVDSSEEAALICDAAKAVGIYRRGIYIDKTFQPIHVHIDVDPEKEPQQCIFIKQEANS